MIYQKKLIFIRLFSFVLFISFSINIVLANYFEFNWALYVLIGLLLLNIAIVIVGSKKINGEVTLTTKDEKVNKGILMTLIVIWLANYLLSSQEYSFKLTLHLILAALMFLIAVIGIITQYVILKKKD